MIFHSCVELPEGISSFFSRCSRLVYSGPMIIPMILCGYGNHVKSSTYAVGKHFSIFVAPPEVAVAIQHGKIGAFWPVCFPNVFRPFGGMFYLCNFPASWQKIFLGTGYDHRYLFV